MIMYTWKILLLSFDFPRCHRRLFQFQHGVLLVGFVLRGPTRVLSYNTVLQKESQIFRNGRSRSAGHGGGGRTLTMGCQFIR